MQAELLLDAQATLGEGPAWDAKLQTIYWVDILGKRIHAFKVLLRENYANREDSASVPQDLSCSHGMQNEFCGTNRAMNGHDDFLQLDEYVGCVAPRRDGGLIAALHASFWTFEGGVARTLAPGAHLPWRAAPGSAGDVIPQPQAGFHPAPQRTFLASVSEPASNRFNDGKCDPAGRLLAGTMDMDEKIPSGNLYSLEAGKPPRKLLDGIRISNGLAWSPDYKIFYYIDTPTRQVRAFDYDLETGNIANPRVVVEVPASMGWPDGMTSDMEGRLWIALWGGGRVSRWDPATGRLEAEVAVPAPRVTSCVFGGARRDILYVTTARVGLDESALAQYPLSGGLFQIQTQTEGMPTFEFAG